MMKEKEFIEGLPRARWHQEQRLADFLKQSSATLFGREHGFSDIDSLEKFRKNVPLCEYSDLTPYIDRILSGEKDILFAGLPYCYLSSSGSSSGKAKILPMSQAYFTDIYNPFLHLYMSALMRHCNHVRSDWDATINFKWDPLYRPATLANGALHLGVSQVDLNQSFQNEGLSEPGTRSPWSQVPEAIDCPVERLYYRIRLAAKHDIRQIVGINPAVIAALPDLLEKHADRLIEELRLGVYGDAQIDAPDELLALRLVRERLRDGKLLPRHLWPRMRSLLCWDQGIASLYLPNVVPLYGNECSVIAPPLGASESPLTMNLPAHGIKNVLAYRSSFYEFIDVQDGQNRPLLLDELQQGGHYRVVVTHMSGLYRYVLGDIVKVTGFSGQAPELEYMGRYNALNPVTESVLIEAVARAASRESVAIRNFTFSQRDDDIVLRLELKKDELSVLPSTELQMRFLETVNEQIGGQRIADLTLETAGTFSESWLYKVSSGLRPPQVKDKVWGGL